MAASKSSTSQDIADFVDVIRAGRIDDVEQLLRFAEGDKSAIKRMVGTPIEEGRVNALHVAASMGQYGIVKVLMDAIHRAEFSEEERLSLVNSVDRSHRTALHHAACEQHAAVMTTLLGYKTVDVNAKDTDGYTPLHLVLMNCNGDEEVLKPLLEQSGIQWNARAKKKNDPTRGSSLSRQLEQEGSQLSLDMLGGLEAGITPMQVLVPDLVGPPGKGKDGLKVLETVWKLKKKEIEGKIVKEIVGQLRSKVVDKEVPEFCTVMHLAAYFGLSDLMRILAQRGEFLEAINKEDGFSRTPLHYASLTGKLETVRFLNEQTSLRGSVEDYLGQTALEIADEVEWKDIYRILRQRQDVKEYLSMQYADRSVYVDGINAVLVGGALIASITFAGWLQPPLGYQPYFQFPRPGAPADTYEQYAAITEHVSVKIFWIFNSLSFFFAIAAILAGVGAMVPRQDLFIRAEVKRLSGALYLTNFAFAWAIVFVVGAFTAAGFASLPPITVYKYYMISTLVVGVFVCYNTFGSSRTSDPSVFIKYSKYVDPGFYFSKSLTLIFKRCGTHEFGYNSTRDRRTRRRRTYFTGHDKESNHDRPSS